MTIRTILVAILIFTVGLPMVSVYTLCYLIDRDIADQMVSPIEIIRQSTPDRSERLKKNKYI